MNSKKVNINVLQVLPALNQGGVERGTLEMAKYVVDKGWNSFVASSGGRLVNQLIADGSKHLQMPLRPRTPWHIALNTYFLVKQIRENNIHLVHVRSRAPAWATFFACKITKVPFITTYHGAYGAQNSFKRFYNSVMLKGSDTIAISHFIKKHIEETYPDIKPRIDVVHRGFDAAVFSPDALSKKDIARVRKKTGVNSKKPMLLLPGRITRLKGQDVFIKALAKLKDIDFEAMIVGGADHKAGYLGELQKLVNDNRLGDKVHFYGHQSSDLPLFYAISDVVFSTNPKKPEAFGRVAVEAMALGKPVIATALGGSAETVIHEKTGWLVKPNDVDALADAIKQAIEHKDLREKYGKQALNHARLNFSTEKMCAGEFDVYKKVLKVK